MVWCAAQCEEEQLLWRFCASRGIAAVPVGPIVFYSGFTRAFLDGAAGSPVALLAAAATAVDALAAGGRRVVIVDGVGYPSVGSVCGVCNAAVARAVGAPVLVVARRGVGDAVDRCAHSRTHTCICVWIVERRRPSRTCTCDLI